jgi:iron complex transport system permease protein
MSVAVPSPAAADSALARPTVLRAGRRVSLPVHRRSVGVTLVLTALLACVSVGSLAIGAFSIPISQVVAALVGAGSADADLIVIDLRLPRVVVGIVVGLAFGLAGAVLQTLARNPLASPDVIGFEGGAAAGAILAITTLQAGPTGVAFGAIVGGLVTALLVYLLAWRGGLDPMRLILIGIGIAAMAGAMTAYLLTRNDIYLAQRALLWLTGSLEGQGWPQAIPAIIGLAVFGPAVLALAHTLRMLELGDDAAAALGVRTEGAKAALAFCSVGLAAVGTAAAGPVAFVALASPQIARRLTRSPGVTLIPAALTGAVIITAADIVARKLLAEGQLPVGTITAAIGAPYLLWLLLRRTKGPT